MSTATVMLDRAADAAVQSVTHAAANTADPGATGASESTAGRAAITWIDNGDGTQTGTATVPVAAGETVTHFSLWDAATAGTFQGGDVLDTPESYGSDGTLDLTVTLAVT